MRRLEESRKAVGKTAEYAPESPLRGRERKAYRAPRLKVFGRIAELTRFGGSQAVDSGVGLGNIR